MIAQEVPSPPQFTTWLAHHIALAQAQSDYVVPSEQWGPYLQHSEQFKQFVRQAPKINNPAVHVLLQFFSAMMKAPTTSPHRCRCWRGLHLLIEKMILDREADATYPCEGLLQVVMRQLAQYQDIKKSESLVEKLQQKHILAVYLSLLCLTEHRPSRVLELTYILSRIELVSEELSSQLFKLDEWLQHKETAFTDSLLLFNIITRGALKEQLSGSHYQFAGVKFHFRSLLPALLRALFSQSGQSRNEFLMELTSALMDEEPLLEVYLAHINHQQSPLVVARILRYVEWQMAQSISVKKVKLLLKNLKMDPPLPDQTTIQLQKLKSYVDLLKDISRRYPEPCMTVEFGGKHSCLTLDNFVKDKTATVCMQFDIKTLAGLCSLFALNHKKGTLQFLLEPKHEGEAVRVVLVVRLGDKILQREVIHNHWKPMSEFLVSLTNEGEHLTLYINSLHVYVREISDLSKIQVGSVANSQSFTGKLKAFVVFSPEVKAQLIYKEWVDCQGRLQAFLRRKEPDSILCKMSRGETLFRFTTKEKGFFSKLFTKEPKHTLSGGACNIFVPSTLQIIEQLGHLDCLLYFIQYINGLAPDHPEVPEILCGLFTILKILCTNDEFYEALDWIEGSLSNLAHLLWLLFIRNGQAPQSVRLVLKIFDFLLYFERRLKYEKNEEGLNSCYRNLECGVLRSVLLKFDVWVLCGLTQQSFVLKVVRGRLQNPGVLKNFLELNGLSHILLSLLVHYNPTYHTDNKLLPENAILELQASIVGICGQLVLEDSAYLERDFKTVMMYIYFAQDTTQEFQCPSILKLLLQFLLTKLISLKSLQRFLSNPTNSSVAHRISLFFCRLVRNAASPEVLELLIEITFALMANLSEQSRQAVMQATLTSLCARSRDAGMTIAPYILLLQRLAKSELAGLPKHLFRVIASMRQCYKLVGRLGGIEALEDSIMNLPQEVLVPFINSDQGFDFLLTISIEQPEHQQIIGTLFENLFVFCYSSTEPQIGIPFIRNFLKVFDRVKLPINSPLSTLHVLCECVDSKYLLKVLNESNLITSQPAINFKTAKQQLSESEYPGGVLGHLLTRNSFSADDIGILKGLVKKRERSIEKYDSEEDLVEFLLPDILFMEMLWTLLRTKMGDMHRKICELGSSRKLSSSSDVDSSRESSPAKRLPQAELHPEAEHLLADMGQMLREHPSILANIAVFGQCQSILGAFYDVLNKQQAREPLLSSYLEMNQRLEEVLPSLAKEPPILNTEMLKLQQLLTNNQLHEAFEHIYNSRRSFQELLKLMSRYCKKDVTLFRKVCYVPAKLEVESPDQYEPASPSTSSEYREQRTNELISELEDQFKLELKNMDMSSENSEELWRNLNNRNRFWLWDKKTDNDIYKLDLHESPNFYHLNIKRVQAEHRAQYARRNQASIAPIAWDRKNERSGLMNASALGRSCLLGASAIVENRSRKPSEPGTTVPKDSKHKYFAQYVTQQGVYFGVLFLKESVLKFKSLQESDRPQGREYQLSTSEFHRLEKPKQKSLQLENAVLFTRRYVMRHTAFELFTRSKGYFFNLFTEQKRRGLINELKDHLSICVVNRKQDFQKHDYTRKWLNGQYNNFQYLMLINRYSGRTCNDLSQFPVFPWVIANYAKSCQQITKDFYRNPVNLRNMELPVGRLNQSRFEGYKMRMAECNEPQQHFLYGSFYSNPTFIYNFFIRLEPFTTLHWEHQGKKIDHADRLFSGVEEQYRSATTNTSDVRELIPEFYYWPEFLRNRNQIELGKKQNKEQVSDAKLPGWARTPEQFIFKMREALESQQITEQLSSWIDLVFGYKNSGEEAEKYDNLFHPLTYEQDMFKLQDEDSIKMAQLNISEFGQVPEALFSKEHPKKKPRHGIMVDHYRQIYSQLGALQFQLSPQGVVLLSEKQLTFISTNFSIVSRADGRSCETVSSKCTMLADKQMSWVAAHENHLSLYLNRKPKHRYKMQSDIYLLTSKYLLIRAQGSQLLVHQLKLTSEQLEQPKKLFGHQQNICLLAANENADVLLSLDRDNLVLVHYISTLKYLRTFKLLLNYGQTVLQIRIHDMGYFVFLTSQGRLFIYTFVGELFAHSDLCSDIDGERATNMQFLSQWQSQIVLLLVIQLLSTSFGSIYQLDFFQLWRFKSDFAHLPFRLRPKRNILYRCRQDSSKDMQYKDAERRQILHFQLLKSSNEFKVLFKVLVLYSDGQLLCFYEKEMMKQHIQSSPLLKQMGIV